MYQYPRHCFTTRCFLGLISLTKVSDKKISSQSGCLFQNQVPEVPLFSARRFGHELSDFVFFSNFVFLLLFLSSFTTCLTASKKKSIVYVHLGWPVAFKELNIKFNRTPLRIGFLNLRQKSPGVVYFLTFRVFLFLSRQAKPEFLGHLCGLVQE